MPQSPRASKRDDLVEFGPPRAAPPPAFSQPPVRLDDADGTPVEAMAGASARSAEIAEGQGRAEANPWSSAYLRFQDRAEAAGLHGLNALALAQSFFDDEADGDAPSRALVEAVLDVLDQEAVLTKAIRAQVVEAARVRLGGKAPALHLSDFSHAGPVPDWVFGELPAPLAACCAPWSSAHLRDVFLTGALPVVSAALPWLRFAYGDTRQGCNLFAMVVAESGAGKRPLAVAGTLLDQINDHLEDESEADIKRWEDAQKDDELKQYVSRECPKWRQLSFPGDSSDAAFFESMYANGAVRGRGGHGMIVESEIMVLIDSVGKEWANYRAKLLQGHANETIAAGRKGHRPMRIRDSELAMSISGTPRSFAAFIQDNEDGLFNRSAFYTFAASDEFENQWRSRDDDRLERALDHLRGLLLDGYRQLTSRKTAEGAPRWLGIAFTEEQQRRQYEAFRLQKRAVIALGYRPLATYTHRTGLIMVRMAGLLTVLRKLSEGVDLAAVDGFTVDERDFRVALQLASTYTAHGIELACQHFRGVSEAPIEDARRKGHRLFFDALVRRFGDASFSRQMAVDLAPDLGLGTRTADRYLAQFLEAGLLSQEGQQGLYYRTPLAPEPSAADVRRMVDPKTPIGYVDPDLLRPPSAGEPSSDGGAHGPPALAPPVAPTRLGAEVDDAEETPPAEDTPF